MDLNIALGNLVEIVVLITVFGIFDIVFAEMMSLADKSTRYEYEDEDDDLFEDDEFTEMDQEDEDELKMHFN